MNRNITSDNPNPAPSLRQAYDRDPAMQVFFDWLGSSKGGMRQTMAHHATQKTNLPLATINRLFRQLEDLGLGRRILGRRGGKTRFEWHCDVREIARSARGEESAPADAPHLPTAEDKHPDAAHMIMHEFRLRPNLKVQIELPMDMSDAEAGRLSTWMRTLPFETPLPADDHHSV